MDKRGKKTGQTAVRVIAGRWRGRRIRFAADGIRPTGDRVRETLFNWLMPTLPGARCLDMFAGSGALGIEALSRGAAHVVFIERRPAAAAAIENTLAEFGLGDSHEQTATVLNDDALRVDLARHGPVSVVFLDPPFAGSDPGIELGNLCTLLENSGALAEHCHIYLEMARGDAVPELPANWRVQREKTAGQVRYALAERSD